MNNHFVYGGTTPLCVGDMRKDWFDSALEVLKTEGSNAWAVMLKGC
jgi:hypothetical protein